MSDNNIKYFVIDANSGEVIIDVYDNQSLSVIEKKKTDYLNATIELNKKKTFVKCYCLPCLELIDVDLTPFEIKILLVMVSNLGYGIYNGIVIKKCNNRFMDFMTSKDIIEIVKCEDSTFKRAIKKFRELEILQTKRKGNKNIYILNPFLFAKEKRIPKTLFKMFRNSKYNYLNE